MYKTRRTKTTALPLRTLYYQHLDFNFPHLLLVMTVVALVTLHRHVRCHVRFIMSYRYKMKYYA